MPVHPLGLKPNAKRPTRPSTIYRQPNVLAKYYKIRNYTKTFIRHEKLAVPMHNGTCQSDNLRATKSYIPFYR
jgi:hypothetical protein